MFNLGSAFSKNNSDWGNRCPIGTAIIQSISINCTSLVDLGRCSKDLFPLSTSKTAKLYIFELGFQTYFSVCHAKAQFGLSVLLVDHEHCVKCVRRSPSYALVDFRIRT